ncbi:hypothetical protein [uncultured Corynebacterium sp.]|uniref:hypothetical protein n=1 Tax=uncultured Corynebacterium sp. TaxID=159447 RepID=UPI0025CDD5C4|nr:hypothetical protein [uncultured Corynebacterium sp.]
MNIVHRVGSSMADWGDVIKAGAHPVGVLDMRVDCFTAYATDPPIALVDGFAHDGFMPDLP